MLTNAGANCDAEAKYLAALRRELRLHIQHRPAWIRRRERETLTNADVC
jgi:hypothetical protein